MCAPFQNTASRASHILWIVLWEVEIWVPNAHIRFNRTDYKNTQTICLDVCYTCLPLSGITCIDNSQYDNITSLLSLLCVCYVFIWCYGMPCCVCVLLTARWLLSVNGLKCSFNLIYCFMYISIFVSSAHGPVCQLYLLEKILRLITNEIKNFYLSLSLCVSCGCGGSGK